MRRMYLFLSVTTCLCAWSRFVSAQDGLKALKDYLKPNKFIVFVPPRTNATVGSIVNYDSGFETIVSSKCLPADKIAPTDFAAIGLSDRDGTLNKNVGIEGSFARALDPSIDISGAYKDERVQTIKIHISDPEESHLESNDVKDYIANAPQGSCLRALTNKRNRILAWVIRVKSMTYNFQDKDGKDISLDAKLLKAIKLSPKYKKDFENKDSLQIDKPIFIAYRAWQATRIPGVARDKVDLVDSTAENIQQLRSAHKQTQTAGRPQQ